MKLTIQWSGSAKCALREFDHLARIARKESNRQTIVSDPGIALGKPVVSGTRITVEQILEKLGAGETVDDLLAAHPRLTRNGINAALGLASKAEVVIAAMQGHGGELAGAFSVLSADSLRIRKRSE